MSNLLQRMSQTRLGRTLRQMHEDERGAEGLEKLLIIAAVVIPLLIALIFFKDTIIDRLNSAWSNVQDDGDGSTFQP